MKYKKQQPSQAAVSAGPASTSSYVDRQHASDIGYRIEDQRAQFVTQKKLASSYLQRSSVIQRGGSVSRESKSTLTVKECDRNVLEAVNALSGKRNLEAIEQEIRETYQSPGLRMGNRLKADPDSITTDNCRLYVGRGIEFAESYITSSKSHQEELAYLINKTADWKLWESERAKLSR